VTVHGLATFAWDAGDEAGRLAAVQLVRLRAATQGLAAGGVADLVPARSGPKGASKLTAEMIARIAGLDAAGQALRQIAAATGMSIRPRI
jgi:hypothetical protein